MRRRLPWMLDSKTPVKSESPPRSPTAAALTSPSSPAPSPVANASRSRTPVASRTPSSRPPRDSDVSRSARSRLTPLERYRSPSTSPPPEPLSESFMIEGLENDDKYRMVEDEFFVIAGKFTAHLHAAEYQRLKNQVNSRNADTIANISRPVVGSLTELARKRQEEVLRRKKQREALKKARADASLEAADEGEDEDEDDAPWRGTALQGLMESPRRKEVSLMSFARRNPRNPRTPAARSSSTLRSSPHPGMDFTPSHGTKRSLNQEDVDTEDDDDDRVGSVLRIPSNRAALPPASLGTGTPAATRRTPSMPVKGSPFGSTPVRKHKTRVHSTPIQLERESTSSPTGRPLRATAKPATTRPLVPPMTRQATHSTPQTTDPGDEDDDSNNDDDEDIFTRFKKRRERDNRRRSAIKREPTPKPPDDTDVLDIIPSFL